MNFTPDQLRAIQWSNHNSTRKHLIIEAGAGAGKTQVLCQRLGWLLLLAPPQERLLPEQIALVTFSRAADAELKERVGHLLSSLAGSQGASLAKRLRISTIDSFFAQLVDSVYSAWWESAEKQSSGAHSPTLRLVDESEAAQALWPELLNCIQRLASQSRQSGSIFDFILSGGLRRGPAFGSENAGAMMPLIKTCLSEVFLSPVAPAVVLASQLIHPASQEICDAIVTLARREFYSRCLRGEMTYLDRTLFLQALLCIPPLLLSSTPFSGSDMFAPQLQLKELIIDEYQDTSLLQHDILFQLASNSQGRLVVVGDPKQSIYRFRGANVQVFNKLTKDPLWEHVQLKTNFRSSPALLKEINHLAKFSLNDVFQPPGQRFIASPFFANAEQARVYSNDLLPGRAPLQSDQSTFPAVKFITVSHHSERFEGGKKNAPELTKVSLQSSLYEKLALALLQYPFPPNQKVVLTETNSTAQKVALALTKAGCKAHALNASQDSPEKRIESEVMEVAHIIARLCLEPISRSSWFKILNSPLFLFPQNYIENIFSNDEAEIENILPLEFKNSILHSRSIIELFPYISWHSLKNYIITTSNQLNKIDLDEFKFTNYFEFYAQLLQSKLDLLGSDTQLARIRRMLDVSVESWIKNVKKLDIPEQSDSILVMTVHAAKGLEWPLVVFVPQGTRSNIQSEFLALASNSRTYLKWLMTDVDSLSVLQRVQNKELTENDGEEITDAKNKKTKQLWFIDLQDKLEQEYERARVFYTAFTRAREHLILCQATVRSNTRKSLRDRISEIKISEGPIADHFDSFADRIFAQYLDECFDLRRSDARGAKPPEPWYGQETEIGSRDPARSSQLQDFGPCHFLHR